MLARIAAMIGCPVEALLSGALPESPLGQVAELLEYWLSIERSEDRREVLDLARGLAVPRTLLQRSP